MGLKVDLSNQKRNSFPITPVSVNGKIEVADLSYSIMTSKWVILGTTKGDSKDIFDT
jgi:hypothetical protein